MITTDLFPNASSFYVGQTANQYTCYLSGDLYNLTIPDVSVFDGYYLGWCNPETLPSCLLQTSYYVDSSNGKLKFFQATPDENFKIGYGLKQPESGGYTARVRTYISDGSSPTTQFSNVQYNYLYNNLYPEYVSGIYSLIITFVYYSPEFNGSSEYGGTFQLGFGYGNYTLSDFLSFLYDDMALSVTLIYNNVSHTITIKYNDLANNFSETFIADTGREYIIYPSGVEWRGREIYNGSYISDGSVYHALVIYNSCVNNYVSDTTHSFDSKNFIITDYIGGEYGFWNGNNNTLSMSVNFISAAIPTCDIDFSELGSSGEYVIFRQNDYGNGGVVFLRAGATERDIYFVSPLKYLISAVMLMWRVQNNRTYSYQLGGSWATDVNENDQFLGEWKTGNIASTVFKNGLREWQYSNIQENEFTPDDVPPYEPPTPTDDGTDSGGDDIRPSDWTNLRISASNNFVTLYGMTAAAVADFGRQLWANLADPAFWQMVGTVFTNDFSINPADMMRYFISLRYFPFDVSDLFSGGTVSGIYVGRAATPIAPSQGVAYPIRVPNNVVQVDGGRLTISRYYNDFRDYEPCTTVQIHVPFCGSVDVPASEVMGHAMDLTYKIDLQTGAMLAVLGVASNTYYVIATLAGTCGATIPITANNNIEFLQRIATVGSGLIGGGVSGAVKGATVGGEVGAVVGAVAGTVGGGVGALAGLPPVTVHKQGNASGFANLGGVPYAYATVQRGRFERPANYGHTTGFACDFSATLGSLSGFTVCDNVDTSGLTCNADERDEIKRLLESGVYV